MGISEWIPCFALLMWECYLLYLLNCLHLNPQVLIFTLLILFPQPTWGGVSECLSGAYLPAGIEQQHGSVNGLDAFKLFFNWQMKCMLKSQSCCSKISLTFKTHSKPHPALVFKGRKKINPKHLCVCLMEGNFTAGNCWDKQTDKCRHLSYMKVNPHYLCSAFTEPQTSLIAWFKLAWFIPEIPSNSTSL